MSGAHDDLSSPPARPVVAIVGRPNVGKSTLLNRVLGHRVAIVEERPGVTRDRKEVEADWNGYPFLLVDTGGWLTGGDDLDRKVSRQSERAILEADVAILVVDAVVGVTEEDAHVAELLRRRNGPVLVVANKVDDAVREGAIWEFVALGLGEPVRGERAARPRARETSSTSSSTSSSRSRAPLRIFTTNRTRTRRCGNARATTKRTGCSRCRWWAARTSASRRCSIA